MIFTWAFFSLISTASIHTTSFAHSSWQLTFQDDFNGQTHGIQQGEAAECYQQVPQCYTAWGRVQPCPEFANSLRDLNKCHWDVYHFYNYMDFDAKEGQGINAFDASQVKVQGGMLILSATRSPFTHFDCKRNLGKDPITGDVLYSKECPYWSGGLDSAGRGSDGKRGFRQQEGRWEIRAQFTRGPGLWPALWLVPMETPKSGPNAGCGWPHNGELDLMEFWTKSPHKITTTFHTGECTSNTHLQAANSLWVCPHWFEDFHTYAVEWSANKIEFWIDEKKVSTIQKNQKDDRHHLPLIFPANPFHIIMNLSIEPARSARAKWRPQLDHFPKQEMKIDWVRVYKKTQ